jgi:hypothetical protein
VTKIFESPAGGKTVYSREAGESERTLESAPDEFCVTCDTETPYKITDHIDMRQHYVEGAGQLCKDCWDKIYGA